MTLAQIDIAAFRTARVLPVIEIDDADRAADLAHALSAGGMKILELTLRTDAALPSLQAMKRAAPDLKVGMGTILTVDQAKSAVDLGADFLVTPGSTLRLLDGLAKLAVRTLPGTATLSEAMAAMEAGFDFLKFFPAEPAGGVNVLKAFAGPLKAAKFCPTGGVGFEKIETYLKLPNVVCVGGSWVAPKSAIAGGDWKTISANAARAVAIKV